MKTLKITALALFVAATNLVCAQNLESKVESKVASSVDEKANAETKALTEKLGLNTVQAQTVSTAVLQRAKQVEADAAKFKGNKEALLNAAKKSTDAFETSVKTVLTPEQKTKYEQMLKAKAESKLGGL
ncbi:MAG TPA: hypothetical protein VK835_08150 [Bacteroidia bacterium]|jgi:protein CpxP|nr:hypothetical protein [Bacteroidia bacterium]